MSKEPMKVVFINTVHVETDANSFKFVVQKLTGKDAPVSPHASSSNKISKGKMERSNQGKQLLKDFSFKNFDKILEQMPLQELDPLWAD
ncbi:VQ protein [Dillenia turbinata]|uniref:VQ protein n=1 Tax=Dillenia turbinata TaxID=194707 RepID=A0AAN8W6N2_9MAGN